ncbi:MAG: TolC family protein [Pseudomonadota bacterium]
MCLSIDWRAPRLLVTILIWILWLAPAAAEDGTTQPEQLMRLAGIVHRALASNLEIQAAKSVIASFKARSAGSELPLNNPELGFEAEHTGVDTYTIGISQTIDWHDKQESLSQVARSELLGAKAELSALQLDKSTQLLQAIGSIQLHQQITQLSKRRIEALDHFTQLVEQRHAAGDIPQAELELARLSSAEATMQHVGDATDLIQAKNDFFSLSGETLIGGLELPDNLPGKLSNTQDLEEFAQNHPQVRASYLTARTVQQKIQATQRENKPDPTLGISAGTEDSEGLIALSLSIPLQLRNKFHSNVDAARADAMQADILAQQAFRNALARLASAKERYNLVSQTWSLWVSQGRSSLQQHIDLLEIQWHAGEMDTTDYLLQVKQSMDTRIASTQLHGELWSAWIEWLSASGTLNEWLKTTTAEH